MSCTLNFKNVSVKAGGKKILENVDFNVSHHDFVTILGPNGAGKSTILKSALGLVKASSGSIEIKHEKITNNNLNRMRKAISYMPQRFDLDRYFPVLVKDVVKNGITCHKKIFEKETGEEKERVRNIIRELKIEKLLEKPFGVISGGEKQKVILAMVLAGNPEILLLDEPNLNLDLYAYRNFLKTVSSIYKKRKLTVLFVTHLITHIPEASKKILVIKEGKSVFEGSPEGLFKEKNHLEFIYG